MSQTSYSNAPALARAGMPADGFECDILSKVAAGSVRLSHAAAFTAPSGINPGTVLEVPAPAVDTDSIIASGVTSTAGIQNLTTASFNGTGAGGGGAEMVPARKIAAVFNNHADWDATTMTIYGFDADGLACQATITIPNGGNATVAQNEEVYFSRVTKVNIPAQTGTNGTLLLGVVADDAQYQKGTLVFPLYDASREPYNSSDQYVDEEPVPCLSRGRFWATVVAGTAGQQLYMRIVESGANYRGQLRGGPATSFVPVLGARIVEMSGSTLALIEVNK